MHFLIGALSFVVWGLVPIYFNKLGAHDPLLVLSHRVFWSAVLLFIYALVRKQPLATLFKLSSKSLSLCVFAGLLMNISWLGFVYASMNGELMAASLAFYISPILVFLMGYLVFKENINRYQLAALALMMMAVVIYSLSEGRFPSLSLFIAIPFALYITVKKHSDLGVFEILFWEHILFAPIAFFYISFATESFRIDKGVLQLMGTAPLQLIPVVMISFSLLKTPLQKISILQYIEPTIHFLLAIFLFNEAVAKGQYYALSLIVVAVLISNFNGRKQHVIN